MSRDYLSCTSAFYSGNPSLKEAWSRLLQERVSLLAGGSERLCVSLAPVPRVEIDLEDPKLEEYLDEPHSTGNRHAGWNFCCIRGLPVLEAGRLVRAEDGCRRLEIRGDGCFLVEVPLKTLYWQGDEGEFWPLALLEYPISAVRMARWLYKEVLFMTDLIVADLVVIGAYGWRLRPDSPMAPFRYSPKIFTAAADILWEDPCVFSFEEVSAKPDLCGFRLVERVYTAFGYGRDAMPREFNEKAGRLALSE